jgi:proteasome lid subunit RPN8/RPN11
VRDFIRIESSVLQRVESHARQEPARECCGLLAGREGVIAGAYPARNAAGNPATEYEIAPAELFAMMREIRAAGLQLLGIYHSHPNGVLEPSPRDVAQAYYPDAAYFIISSAAGDEAVLRAFSIRDGRVSQLQIAVV